MNHHLTEQERSYFESVLKARQDELAAALEVHTEERDALQQGGPGGGELARESQDANALADIAQTTLDREVLEARATAAALGRLAAGTYGLCEACGQTIPFERLKANPTSSRCLACQTAEETGRLRQRL